VFLAPAGAVDKVTKGVEDNVVMVRRDDADL